jgi:nuclease S1
MIIYRLRIPVIIASVLAALLFEPFARAWGPVGHQVASRIAEERLTPAALKAVHDLLGSGVSLADISYWAEEQRNMSGRRQWHYVNVPITESRYDPKYCQLGRCLVSKIEDFKRVLQNPKAGREEKEKALKFFVHFIEDLCQPLHVGDTGSKGGNLIQVHFYSIGSDLHRVWDLQIIDRRSTDERMWLADLRAIANPKLVAEWSKGTPEDWATDTLQVAKKAYSFPGTDTAITSEARLGDAYYGMALPMIQAQLAKAGVRLAAMLNEIFR